MLVIEYDIWMGAIYYTLNHNKKYIEKFSNSENISLILTTTVNIDTKINYLNLVDPIIRKNIYIDAIKKWLNNTNFNIILVENSGYEFPELEYEKEKYKNKFEIISFNEQNLEEAKYLKNNSSKGAHEFFSIDYAINNSKLIKNSKFVIKITGRYYIPNFKNFINNINIFDYIALRQFINMKCEIVGSHIDYINYIFDKNTKIEIDFVELEWKNRIDKLDNNKVLNCPLFKIEPTILGSISKKNYYL
jgi:hypothetical protein